MERKVSDGKHHDRPHPRLAGRLCWTVMAIALLSFSSRIVAQSPNGSNKLQRPKIARWAVIAEREIRDAGVTDLLTAQLSQRQDLHLVEREELDKVLAELELTAAAALARPSGATRLGKLTSAEAILYLDQAGRGQAALLRVRLVEARTGIQLGQWLVPRSQQDDEVAELVSQLDQTRQTLRLPEDVRQYVGIVGVYSEEAAHTFSAVARSLTALLEHDLGLVPGIVVLERELLDRYRVNDLTDTQQRVHGSTLLVEAGFRHQGDGYRFTLALRRPGEEPKYQHFSTNTRDGAQVRSDLLRAVSGALNAAREIRPVPDPYREALVLARRRDWLVSQDRHVDAIPLAHAVHLLQPTGKNWRKLRDAYSAAARQQNHQSGDDKLTAGQRRTKQRVALQMCLEMHQLDLAMLQETPAEQLRDYADRGLDAFGPEMRWVEDELRADRLLREEIDRHRMAKFQLMRQHRDFFFPKQMLLGRLRRSGYYADTPEEFCKVVQGLVKEIDVVYTAHRERHGFADREYFDKLVEQFQFVQDKQAPTTAKRSPLPWSVDQLRPLIEMLRTHEDPLFRIIGLYALCEQEGAPATVAARQLFHALLQSPAEEPLRVKRIFLNGRAVQRLHEAGALIEELEIALLQLEQKRDPLPLFRRPLLVFTTFTRLSEERRVFFARRMMRILESRELTEDEQRRAALVRNQLGHYVKQIAPKTAQGAWNDYELTELEVTGRPPTAMQIISLGVDQRDPDVSRDDELLVLWNMPQGKATVGRVRIVDGQVVATSPAFAYRNANFDSAHASVVASPVATFVASNSPGLVMIRDGQAKAFGPDEGAPGKDVDAIAWLDGQLYVTYRSCLARFDPDTETFSLIASGNAVKINNPLDGGARYLIFDMLADAARKCLWLTVEASTGSPRLGIWKYTPATGEFKRCFGAQHRNPFPLSRLTLDGDFISFSASRRWFQIDAEDAVKELMDYALFEDRYEGRSEKRFAQRLGDHFFGGNGQIFTPQGEVFRHPQHRDWSHLVRCGDGFIAADSDDGSDSQTGETIWQIRAAASK